MIKEKNIIFAVLLSILIIVLFYRLNLVFSPDSKTFLNTAKNISHLIQYFYSDPLYTSSYLIFKFLLSFGEFETNFKIFNFLSFFS